MMRPLGTILPTAASLAAGDAAADRRAAEAERVGQCTLGHLARRVVGGESRYYTADGGLYAVVSRRDLRVRWFALAADGHWYAADHP